MEPESFTLPSSNGADEVCCFRWMPEGEPVAALQIVHGMTEHILRYSEFAEHMASKGFAVYGHDHAGHGRTSDEKGFFAEEEGWRVLVDDVASVNGVDDVASVNGRMRSDLPDVPHLIMGHSMGSYVTRMFLKGHSGDVDGAAIMGTGNQAGYQVSAVLMLSRIMCALRGAHGHSGLLDKLVFGTYDKKFDSPDLPNRWLCSDPEALIQYRDDPLCGFSFTCAGYRDLFSLIRPLVGADGPEGIRPDLPVLFVSGEDDPVGGFGKGVRKAAANMMRYVQSVDVILYPGMRHEVLNEIGKEGVMDDISEWMEGILHRKRRGLTTV